MTLLVFAVLSRLVMPAQFGLISLAAVFTAIFQVFVDSGFSKSIIQRKHLTRLDTSTAFWTAFGMAVALYIVLYFTAPLLSIIVQEPDLTGVVRVLALALPINALALTPAALLERDFGFRALSIRSLLASLAGSVVAIVLALLGAGVWALVGQTLVGAGTSVVALWASTAWRPTREFSRDSLRELASTGFGILGIDLLDAIQANADKFLIGALFSATELGYYFLAQRVGTILVELVTSVISRISLTTFSRMQSDPARLNRALRQLTFASTTIGIPVFALVAAFGPQIIPTAFGPQWGRSVPILWILLPSWILASLMYFDRGVLLATGHAKTAFGIALVQNVIGIIAVFLLSPFGIYGVAASRSSRLLTWPTRLHYLRKYAHIQLVAYITQPLRCILAIGPSIALVLLLQQTSWAASSASLWTFALPCALVALGLYSLLIYLLAGPENRVMMRDVSLSALGRLKRNG